jgi:hypothetical protein
MLLIVCVAELAGLELLLGVGFKQSSVNKVMCKVFLCNGIFLVIATDRWTVGG